MTINPFYMPGENVYSKQKIRYWLNVNQDIHWHAFILYISQYISIIDFTEDNITVLINSIGDYDFFIENAKDYNDNFWRQYYNMALNDTQKFMDKNPNIDIDIMKRLKEIDYNLKDIS